MSEHDIFEKAKTYGSFNSWLTSIPEEDLQYLCDITDKASEELKDSADIDAFEQMCALAMFFSGQHDPSEEQLKSLFTTLTIMISSEMNIRKGRMTKTGIYSMVSGEDTSRFTMTPAGLEYVREMLKDNNSNGA